MQYGFQLQPALLPTFCDIIPRAFFWGGAGVTNPKSPPRPDAHPRSLPAHCWALGNSTIEQEVLLKINAKYWR